jgi:hypothetical protein
MGFAISQYSQVTMFRIKEYRPLSYPADGNELQYKFSGHEEYNMRTREMISYKLQDFHCMTLSKPGVNVEIVQARAHSQVYSQRYNLKPRLIPLHYPQNIKTARIRNVATQLGWSVIYVALTSYITTV